MQFLSDQLNVPVERPVVPETTALGAASLAGLAAGVFESTEELADAWRLDRSWEPAMDGVRRAKLYDGWGRAVRRILTDESDG